MPRVLITGANRGIGAALMIAARDAGHSPIGTTRHGGDGFTALTLDRPDTIAAQLAQIGAVDIVINNAGVIGPDRQSPLDMDFIGFAQTLAVNTLAPLAVVQALLPRLRDSATPLVLTLSSQMAWMGYRKPDRIAYRASKAALNKVMQGLASTLEPDRIPVVVIDPGWVRTDMGGPEADQDPATVAAGIIALINRVTLADTGKFLHFTGKERPF
ncbi:short-chain dehydrogenase [Loktanella sp. 3ANDIMAR09]|uniref:SDR family NAD(P)-dependent oxidoreductase n=1 Tax=Loktanella sp. 3ANDIMAR09 TaxID=1225657 RepID=UPI0006F296E1|nr:SDR family NAD(P)-dependent oxidoreductase [Loktanella sp. 3ANDIMAR09]KQI67466.1 short-chain dehydrogenase [Loktanella sp. 3ANDIMAR09]